jgi:hypothetical protein
VISCAHTATIQGAPGEVSLGTGAYFTPSAGNQFAGNERSPYSPGTARAGMQTGRLTWSSTAELRRAGTLTG